MNLTIFVCGHDEKLARIPEDNVFVKVNLTTLSVGEFQQTCFAESRLWLSSFPDKVTTDYVGQMSANWDQKNEFWGFKLPLMKDIARVIEPLFAEDAIIVPYFVDNWVETSNYSHPGMGDLILELSNQFNWKVGSSGWASTFFCHNNKWSKFLIMWRCGFNYLWTKYGMDVPFDVKEERFMMRKYAVLLERLTMLILANLDTKVIKI